MWLKKKNDQIFISRLTFLHFEMCTLVALKRKFYLLKVIQEVGEAKLKPVTLFCVKDIKPIQNAFHQYFLPTTFESVQTAFDNIENKRDQTHTQLIEQIPFSGKI